MTAPDPGLTDLIAAHVLSGPYIEYDSDGHHADDFYRCGENCKWTSNEGTVNRSAFAAHAAHVALVVEQHTNGGNQNSTGTSSSQRSPTAGNYGKAPTSKRSAEYGNETSKHPKQQPHGGVPAPRRLKPRSPGCTRSVAATATTHSVKDPETVSVTPADLTSTTKQTSAQLWKGGRDGRAPDSRALAGTSARSLIPMYLRHGEQTSALRLCADMLSRISR